MTMAPIMGGVCRKSVRVDICIDVTDKKQSELDVLAEAVAANLKDRLAPPRLMTAKQAAEYLGINVHAFNTIVKKGGIAGVVVDGLTHPRYFIGDLDTWIEQLPRPLTA